MAIGNHTKTQALVWTDGHMVEPLGPDCLEVAFSSIINARTPGQLYDAMKAATVVRSNEAKPEVMGEKLIELDAFFCGTIVPTLE